MSFNSLKFFFILSSVSVLTNGLTYPVVPDPAVSCIDFLNETHVLGECEKQAMKKWPSQFNGQKDDKWEERDTCCMNYDQIDCVIQGIKNNCSGTGAMAQHIAEAALNYENQLINWWNTTHCLTIPYKSGLCKANSPSPPPAPSDTCLAKCYDMTRYCMRNLELKWNVTESQLTDGNEHARGMCCPLWDMSDCIVEAVQANCNSTEIEYEKNRQDYYIKSQNSGVCANFTYHSSACVQAEPSKECIKKSTPELNTMSQKLEQKWNITDDQMNFKDLDVPAKKFCCAQWDGQGQAMDIIKKNCNSTDVELYQRDMDQMTKMLDGGRCVNFTSTSNECPGSNRHHNGVASQPTINSMFFAFPLICLALIWK